MPGDYSNGQVVNDALYSYDRVGNRLTDTVGSLSANSGTRYYTVNAGNRLTNIRTGSITGPVYESYQYDANGSLTQISGNRNLSLSWDANNRASAISGRTYSYDPADYRIGKGGTGATLNYYLDGEHLDAVYDGGITVQSQHLRGSIIDEVVYSYQRDNTNKLVAATSHHDALQSVLGESNHQGAIQYRQAYTAFGTATNTSQPQRYTGREMDSESGLYYYRARYYDPVTGRFISEDPLGFQAGVNFYAYCLNNPVNCNDPSGNEGIRQALTDPVFYQLLGQRALEFGQGVVSYPVGIARGVNFGTQLLGLQGADLQSRSQLDFQILSSLSNQAIQNPTAAYNIATNYISQNVPRVTGRLATGFGAGLLISRGVPSPQNYIIGPGLAGLANFGDAMNAIDNGVNTLEGIIPPLLGGAPANPSINFNLNIQINSSSSLSNNISNYLGGSLANGGFLLYPNKSNTNTIAQVYAK